MSAQQCSACPLTYCPAIAIELAFSAYDCQMSGPAQAFMRGDEFRCRDLVEPSGLHESCQLQGRAGHDDDVGGICGGFKHSELGEKTDVDQATWTVLVWVVSRELASQALPHACHLTPQRRDISAGAQDFFSDGIKLVTHLLVPTQKPRLGQRLELPCPGFFLLIFFESECGGNQ